MTQDTLTRPEWLIDEPAEVYHAKRRDYLTSSSLKEFRRCPAHFHAMQNGLVEPYDSAAFQMGTMVHAVVLEGESAINARYEFVENAPVNPKTGKPYGPTAAAYREWASEHGKDIITAAQCRDLLAAANAVRGHAEAMKLIGGDGWGEGVARADYEGLPSQVRIDWLASMAGELVIVDLKTCADLDYFEQDAAKFGYIHQLAFYREVSALAGGLRHPCAIVAVEKTGRYRCGVGHTAEVALDRAEAENADAIQQIEQCYCAGSWPTGYEQPRVMGVAS